MTPSRLPRRIAHFALSGMLLALLAACGGAPSTVAPTAEARPTSTPRPSDGGSRATPTEAPATTGEATLVAATFTKKLGENQEPVEPTESFYPDETVYISLEFEGRPENGIVRSEFFWGDESIAAAEVDFADVNSGVLISIGQSTYASFNLSPNQPFPVSNNYRVVSTLDGEDLGEFPYSVVQPEGSIPSKIATAVLATDHVDYEPTEETDVFAPDQQVFLVGRGDLGVGAWMKAELYADGTLVEDAVTTLGPIEEDASDTGFAFDFTPEGTWGDGEYEVVLYLNDEEVERLSFTASESAAPVAATTVEFGELETFSPESGLFSIEVPQDWSISDNSNDLSVNYAWQDDTGTAGILVSLYENPEELSEEQLIADGTDFVQNAFGSEPEFEILETTPQSDGSVLIAWNATPEMGGAAVKLLGLTYIQQNGDKVSLLNAIMPDAENDALWEGGFSQIVNSYSVDPSVKIIQ